MDMSKCPVCRADTYLDRRGGSELRGCTCGWRMVERHPVDAGKAMGGESIPVLLEEIARLRNALSELVEVADLRGDSDIPHPCDDPKLWTARMQSAWDNARSVLGGEG